MTALWILLGIVLFVAIYWITTYNRFIRLRNEIKNAFGSIDAVLKQRFDLLPNLVTAVKEYADHESEIFIQVAALRGGKSSYNDLTPQEKETFNQGFGLGIRNLYAVSERYPELRASTHFMHLQRTLNELEEQLLAARRTYNAIVTEYNIGVQSFPSSFIAGIGRFEPEKEVLETAEEERQVPNLRDIFGNK